MAVFCYLEPHHPIMVDEVSAGFFQLQKNL